MHVGDTYELIVDDGHGEESIARFDDLVNARRAFLKAVKTDPHTATVYKYDADEFFCGRVFWYDGDECHA